MKHEEKAKKIAEFFNMPNGSNCLLPCHQAAMAMAEWMIDKACEWLKDMACYYAHWEYNGDTYEKEVVYDTELLIKDFVKAMEGGDE